jgi:hypothetical protein
MVIVTPAEVMVKVNLGGKDYVFGTGKHEVDFVVLTSIHYALARVGMPVVQFKDSMDVNGQREICICGHGGVGTIEGLPASRFAKVLADPVRGCKDTLEKLILTCCYAGVREKDKVGTAVIDIFAETLKIKDLKIQGALGPSIKTNALGTAFRVVNPDDKMTDKAGDVQAALLKDADKELVKKGLIAPEKFSKGKSTLATPSGGNRKMDWEKIESKMGDRSKAKGEDDYIIHKAKKYSDLSTDFFKNFEKQLEREGLLLDSHHNMRTVYWDGSQVVTEAPPKSGNRWCYITTATAGALGLPDDCAELTALRRFRDEVLLSCAAGRHEVREYYATAPAIVAAIDRLPDAGAVYRHLYRQSIAPAVAAVLAGRHAEAYGIYRRLVGEARDRYQ